LRYLAVFCLFHFNIISSFWKWQMDFLGAALGISICLPSLTRYHTIICIIDDNNLIHNINNYNNLQFCLRCLAVNKMATNIWRYFTLRMRDYPRHVSIRLANIYSILSSINIYPLLNTVLKTMSLSISRALCSNSELYNQWIQRATILLWLLNYRHRQFIQEISVPIIWVTKKVTRLKGKYFSKTQYAYIRDDIAHFYVVQCCKLLSCNAIINN